MPLTIRRKSKKRSIRIPGDTRAILEKALREAELSLEEVWVAEFLQTQGKQEKPVLFRVIGPTEEGVRLLVNPRLGSRAYEFELRGPKHYSSILHKAMTEKPRPSRSPVTAERARKEKTFKGVADDQELVAALLPELDGAADETGFIRVEDARGVVSDVFGFGTPKAIGRFLGELARKDYLTQHRHEPRVVGYSLTSVGRELAGSEDVSEVSQEASSSAQSEFGLVHPRDVLSSLTDLEREISAVGERHAEELAAMRACQEEETKELRRRKAKLMAALEVVLDMSST